MSNSLGKVDWDLRPRALRHQSARNLAGQAFPNINTRENKLGRRKLTEESLVNHIEQVARIEIVVRVQECPFSELR